MASSLMRLATASVAIFAAVASAADTHVAVTQPDYTSCHNTCAADPTCRSWDWNPIRRACDLRATPYAGEVTEETRGNRPPPSPPPTPDPALQKLEQKYGALLNASCAKVVAKVPTLDAGDASAFMTAYQAYNGTGSDATVWEAARKLITPTVDAFLSLPDSFDSADGLDANMVLCAVLNGALTNTGGSPAGAIKGGHALANYAVLGAAQEATVDKLLADFTLMRDMLVAGGAASGNYGQAAAIYYAIESAYGDAWTTTGTASSTSTFTGTAVSDPPPPPPPGPPLPPCPAAAQGSAWDDREPANVLKRLALGVAVTLAENITHRYAATLPNSSKNVDPIGRYSHFVTAYNNGELDPAFPILTAFELAHAVDSDATDEDQAWVRQTLANYMPNEVSMDYSWRFCESVHSDVQYGDSQCSKFPAGVCSGRYADIPCGGDVCGGRAFWGRFARKAFGLPTWGATEKGHASMSSWTPTGWIRQLGSQWPFCWWGARSGPDWYLDTQARDNQCAYQKYLRGSWAAIARGDAPIDIDWRSAPGNSAGGLWSALMVYYKTISVAESPAPNRTIPAAVPPIVNKIDALIRRQTGPAPPTPSPSTDSSGSITIPAVAFTSKNRSASISVEFSFDQGQQILHGGCSSPFGAPCMDPPSSAWTYNFTSTNAGNFYLTANFTTYHWDQDVYVSVNGAKPVEVPVYYNLGYWNQSLPIEVALLKGDNSMTFTRTSVRQLVFKEFLLSVNKPNVPQPPGNYTPAPAPPPAPPGGDYIEVPASTTCEAQGIKPVPEEYCPRACAALGFKDTGDRARPNMSGCFVMADGQYAGNCNYNTNTSATCTPPCTLFGATVRALCIRN
eukprot:m.140890 g.140890  ORF g.140890 m.140890 type:complete len:848 (-) comp11542_c0_seq6:303-2846(-)